MADNISMNERGKDQTLPVSWERQLEAHRGINPQCECHDCQLTDIRARRAANRKERNG